MASAYRAAGELGERVRELEAEAEFLRAAIAEHRAAVVMGARNDYDVNDADEALWCVLCGEAGE